MTILFYYKPPHYRHPAGEEVSVPLKVLKKPDRRKTYERIKLDYEKELRKREDEEVMIMELIMWGDL